MEETKPMTCGLMAMYMLVDVVEVFGIDKGISKQPTKREK